ncbi:MAG: hypothetical protein Q7V48_07535 [Deltaproteobacteria bacterium]|nr:hypothetical protein [Deltaproteobacteria bacterium]MDO9210584.1 hypothetical protein [Deltaproteobacteria bacterium]
MRPLKERWASFLTIICDPLVLIFLVLTILLGIFLKSQQDPVVIAALTIIITLISGILGAILKGKWNEITEEKVIVTRGKTAVRSLKLLLSNILSLEKRVCEYLFRSQDEQSKMGQSPEVIKTYLEEIIGRCRIQGEEAISSIENWTDIVPEADIRTQIGVISNLREEGDKLIGEVNTLKETLAEAKNQKIEETAKLKKEIDIKEEELRKIKYQLFATSNRAFGTSGISGYPGISVGGIIEIGRGSTGVGVLSEPTTGVCFECGKPFDSRNSLALAIYPRCPDCEKKAKK